MRLVAECQDCGEQKILEEWMRCKSCRAKWFSDALNKPDYPTDNDAWFVTASTPKERPLSALGPKPCNHKSVQENLDCVDDLYDLQPEPAKVDAAVARMNELVPRKVSPGPTFFDNFFSERAAKAQRELNNIFRDILPTKDLRFNKP